MCECCLVADVYGRRSFLLSSVFVTLLSFSSLFGTIIVLAVI